MFLKGAWNMKRVTVLGVGPAGLAQLHAFQSAAQRGAEIPEIVCYENRTTGEACETTRGGRVWTSTENRSTRRCTATC